MRGSQSPQKGQRIWHEEYVAKKKKKALKLHHRIGVVMNPLLRSMLLPLPLETNTAIYTPWTLDYATRVTDIVVSRNQIP